MIKTTRALALTGALTALVAASACKTDLNVPNLNAPNVTQVIVTGADVQTVIGNSFFTMVNAVYTNDNLGITVSADEGTSSYGNFGMRFNGQEPRIPFNNLASASNDVIVANTQWNGYYGALGSANDGLRAIAKGTVITSAANTAQYKTFAQFMQGWIYSQLAMNFDKAFIPDEVADPSTLTLQPYATVGTAALAKLDLAIAGLTGQTYSFPAIYVEDFPASAAQLAAFANSLAARQLVEISRTGTSNTATNWARVLTYANKGVASDYMISTTTTNPLGPYWWYYGINYDWVRPDMRLTRMMDSTQPSEFTDQIGPPRATSNDVRLGRVGQSIPFSQYTYTLALTETADFRYNTTTLFAAARGIYFFTYWSFNRYKYYSDEDPNGGLGATPMFLKAENDLIKAEALVRTGGDFNLAATLINNTRVTRGQLAPATGAMTAVQLLADIQYERLVELYHTHPLVGWGDARRLEQLYAGAWRSLPVPAGELGTLNLPIYTFGGIGLPDGH